MIWGILTKDKSDDDSGLHCDKNNSGAAQQLCDLLRKLRKKSDEEEKNLNGQERVLITYNSNINNYMCNCNMGTWLSVLGPCTGPDVKDATIYENCNVNQKHNENSCRPIKSQCGSGTRSMTRMRVWDRKQGGKTRPGQACPTGMVRLGSDVGTLSEVDNDKKQTFTVPCKAGKYNGECREY